MSQRWFLSLGVLAGTSPCAVISAIATMVAFYKSTITPNTYFVHFYYSTLTYSPLINVHHFLHSLPTLSTQTIKCDILFHDNIFPKLYLKLPTRTAPLHNSTCCCLKHFCFLCLSLKLTLQLLLNNRDGYVIVIGIITAVWDNCNWT